MTTSNLDNELSKLKIDKSKKRYHRRGLHGWTPWLVLAVVAGGGWFFYAKAHGAVEVKVAQPIVEEPGSSAGVEVLTASGYIIPRQNIDVSSKIVGRVKEVYIREGQRVDKDAVLLRLDDEDYRAQVNMAEAGVNAARARVAELHAGSRPQAIAAANAAVDSAQATLHDATIKLDRLKKLRVESVVSQDALDNAQTAHDVAQAALDSALKNAELVRIGPRQEQIDLAEAELRQAEANLQYARTQLDFTVIRAPIAGTILEKVAEVGELVTNANFGGTRGAKTSVVTMADLADLQVEIDLNENDIGKVALHQPCEIRLDSSPKDVYKGEVDEIAPQADRQKATVQVKVRVLTPDERLRPESSARVTFLEPAKAAAQRDQNKPRIWIPPQAMTENGGKPIVYLAVDGRAKVAEVKAGDAGPRGQEILEGLTGGETIILEPLQNLRNGTPIKIAG